MRKENGHVFKPLIMMNVHTNDVFKIKMCSHLDVFEYDSDLSPNEYVKYLLVFTLIVAKFYCFHRMVLYHH